MKKDFIILGPINSIKYNDMFPYIMSREVFVKAPNDNLLSTGTLFIDNKGDKVRVPCVWYSNLDSKHLYRKIELTKTYSADLYPKYDNYDAINVDKIKDIPKDYSGVMGVPITAVVLSPEQIEIINVLKGRGDAKINGIRKFARIGIKLKNSE